MNLVLAAGWWCLVGAVTWQSAVGFVDLAGDAWRARAVGLGSRLCGSTDERLGRSLGADFPAARALREVARAHELVLCRIEFTPAALDERTGSIARMTRLRHALFPTPQVTNGGPAPLAMAERELPPGQSVLLLVLGDEPAPVDRPGWSCERRGPGFQVWRLQRK